MQRAIISLMPTVMLPVLHVINTVSHCRTQARLGRMTMKMKMLMIGAAAASLMAGPASADTVTDWWETAHRYWLASQGAPGPMSPDTVRAPTRATLAMFEAVNAIDRRYQSYLGMPEA